MSNKAKNIVLDSTVLEMVREARSIAIVSFEGNSLQKEGPILLGVGKIRERYRSSGTCGVVGNSDDEGVFWEDYEEDGAWATQVFEPSGGRSVWLLGNLRLSEESHGNSIFEWRENELWLVSPSGEEKSVNSFFAKRELWGVLHPA